MNGKAAIPKKKKILIAAALSALIAAAAVTGVVTAFLTKTVESRANNFTFVTADVELTEPSWNLEDSPIVTPGQTVAKDPTVTNTGETPLYVFLEVKIPCDEVQTADSLTPHLTNLLNFEFDRENWVKVSPDTPVYENDTTGKEKYSVEVYAYLKELAPKDETGAKSTPLFSEVKYADVIEGEPNDSLTFDMPISVYAIQTENLEKASGADTAAKLKDVYNAYIKKS